MFWVQVLLGVSFLLGAALICTYCRWQPCKSVVPGKFIHVLHTALQEVWGKDRYSIAPMQKGKLRGGV